MIDMNKDFTNLIKEKLDGYSMEPSGQLWTKVNRTIRWKKFTSYNPVRFNIYYAAALSGIIAFSSYIMYTPEIRDTENTNSFVPVISEVVELSPAEAVPNEILENESVSAVVETSEEMAEVDFIMEPAVASNCAPLTIEFKDQSKNISDVNWDFGDGTNSKKRTILHTFEQPGTFLVKLTARTKNNTEISKSQSIKISGLPKIQFSHDAAKSDYNAKKIAFVNTSENASQYLWDFGDGSTSTEKNPVHQFSNHKNYSISLTAVNQNGCSDSISQINRFLYMDCSIGFPESFAPITYEQTSGYYLSANNQNGVFYPNHKGIDSFSMEVIAPNGQLIFKSSDILLGWNGYYKGRLVPAGKYKWRTDGVFANGESFNFKGEVNVVINQIGDDYYY